MASQIKLKRSSVPGNSPTFGTEIVEGELALNTADQKLYSANSSATFVLADSAGGITASSGADNRVAVFSSNSSIEGDANFTWDGSSLDVVGVVDASSGFRFGTSSNYLYQSNGPEVTLKVGTRPVYFQFNQVGATGPVRLSATTGPFALGVGQYDHLKISAAETVINEDGGTMDFRVESNNNANMLFVDGTNDRVGIACSAPTQTLDVAGTITTSANVHITGAIRDSGGSFGTSGQVLSSTGAGGIDWIDAASGSGTVTSTGGADNRIAVFTGADEIEGDANFTWDGTNLNADGGAVFNESGADVDFRVESDTLTHALFVQGSDGRVGINTSAPGSPLEVGVASGTSGATSALRIISTDGGAWGVYPTSAVANPVWNTNVNSGEQFSWSVGGGEVVRIDAFGKVGIACTSPTVALDVVGDTNISGNFTSIGIDDNATGERLQISDTALSLGDASSGEIYSIILRSSNDGQMRLSGGNASNAGANLRLFGGTHATQANDFAFYADTTVVGQYDHSITTWDFQGNDLVVDTDTLFVDASADRVGIGTNAPASLLHIASTGEAKLTIEGDSDNDASEEAALIQFKSDGGAVGHSIGIEQGTVNDLVIASGNGTASHVSTGISLKTKPTSTTTTQQRMSISSVGDIAFYDDTSSSADFFWDASTQRLGIGTNSPAGPLDVTDGSTYRTYVSTAGDLIVQSTSGGDLLQLIDITDIGTANSANPYIEFLYATAFGGSATRLGYIGYGSTSISDLFIRNEDDFGDLRLGTDATDRIYIKNTGEVGIACSAPTVALDVVGDARISDTSPNLILDDTNGTLQGGLVSIIDFRATGSSHGSVGFNTGSGVMRVTNTQGDLYLEADSSDTHGSSDVRFVIDGNTEALVNSTGLGIGTISPDQALDVVGTITTSANVHITGSIRDSSGDYGTSGQVLSSTGSGIDWIDASAISGALTASNGVDNRIAVFTSSSNIEGDANFTWDGSSLGIVGDMFIGGTGQKDLKFYNNAGTDDGTGVFRYGGDAFRIRNGGTNLTAFDQIQNAGIEVRNSTDTAVFQINPNATVSSTTTYIAGSVGIACTSPTVPLDVVGTTQIRQDAVDSTFLQFVTDQNGTDRYFLFKSPLSDTDINDYFSFENSNALKFEIDADPVLRLEANGDLSLGNTPGGDPIMHVDKADARVGIGTITPVAPLNIKVGDIGGTLSLANGGREFVIESNETAGITIATPDSSTGQLNFGDPGNSQMGKVTYDHATDRMYFYAGGSSRRRVSIDATETVMMDALTDFRVEASVSDYMLFVDASTDRVGIACSAPTVALDVVGNTNISGTFTSHSQSNLGFFTGDENILGSFEDNLSNDGSIDLLSVRTSGASTNWTASQFRLQARVDTTRQSWIGFNGDSSYGGNYGVSIGAGTGGTSLNTLGVPEVARFESSIITMNPNSRDQDFRVESDNLVNALFVRGSDGDIGIGTDSPGGKLDIRATNERAVNIIATESVSDVGGRYEFNLDYNYTMDGTTTTANRTKVPFYLDVDVGGTVGVGGSGAPADGTRESAYAGFVRVNSTHTAGTMYILRGLDTVVTHGASANVYSITGTQNYALHSGTGSLLNVAYGCINLSNKTSTADGGSYTGTATYVRNSSGAGTMGTATVYQGYIDQDSTSNISTGYIYRGWVQGSGTGQGINTAYGLWLDMDNGYTGTIGTAYGVYVVDEDRNYFSGSVGIGITAPNYALDVNGDIKLSSTGTLWFDDTAGGVEKITSTSGALDLYADAQMRFIESDSSTVAATINVNDSRMGIACTSPTQALDVAGTITTSANVHITGAIRDSGGSFGTSGQVLSSTGTGIDWIDAGTGSVTSSNGADNRIAVFTSSSNIEGDADFTYNGTTLGLSGSASTATIDVGSNLTTGSAIINLGAGRSSSGFAYIDLIGDTTYTDYGLRLIRNNSGANAGSALQSRGTGTLGINTIDAGAIQFNTTNTTRMFIASGGNVGIACTNPTSTLVVNGSVTKGSGSFKIEHPIKPETHHLVHSFVEGPQADNIYRGRVDLVNGLATVNIDSESGMTEGTFVALNRDVQCLVTNESGWIAVKGSVSGNILTVIAQDNTCADTVSWLVIGERQDQHMYESSLTDENGKIIVEPEKT